MKIKFSFVYVLTSLCLIVLSFIMGDLWLINTQVAFICSMLIIFASFFSYKRMIEDRLENTDSIEILQDRDELDKIDDKYELFTEEEDLKEQELTQEEFVKLYKKEKKRASGFKHSFSNMFKNRKGLLNPFRILSYAFLCIAVLVLIKNNLFSAVPFFVGVGAVPISSLIFGLLISKEP